MDTGRGDRKPLESVFNIINEKTRKAVENPVGKVLQTGRIVGLANHTVLIARDGSERAIDDSAAPIQNSEGELGGVVLVFRDVTEQRRAEPANQFLASLVDSSDDAIVGKDVNGIVTSWNGAAERMFGYSAAEMIGQPIARIAPPERPDEMPGILERIRRGERVHHFDTIRRAKDGRLVPISLTVSPIKDEKGNIIGASKIARDISERKRAEMELGAERARLHTTLVSIGDAVIVAGAGGAISLINPMAQALTGWTEREAVGQPLDKVFRILNEKTRQPVENPVARVLRENTVVGLANHTTLIAKDETEIPIDDSGAPIQDPDGTIVGVVLVFRDITARRRADLRLRLLWEAASMLLASNQPDSMLRELFAHISPHLGLDTYFSYVVSDTEDALQLVSCAGVPEETARNMDRLELGQAICGAAALHRKAIVAAHIQESNDPKAELVKSLGMRTYACYPLQLGERLFGTLSFGTRTRDEFDKEELELLRTISDYVAVAYDRLRLVAQLQDANRRKDEFLAILAHELRNPLAPIRTGLELMRLVEDVPPTIKQTRAMLERQVAQMVRLVDDLLDVGRITTGRIELKKKCVDVAVVAQNAAEASRPSIDESGHELMVILPDRPIYADVDPARLAQAISNLLNNASIHSEKGGRIWLTVKERDGEVLITVRDTGVGIDAEQLPRIFEMFWRAKSGQERAPGGLGIGLSLVKAVIELQGGKVEAYCAGVGMGSEFTISLPAATKAPSAQDTGNGEVSAQRRYRILVVDDNRDAADFLVAVLESIGHEAYAAYDGVEALQAAATSPPEAVLLDIGLPNLDGYEVARQMRKQPWGKEMTLIALSGWGQAEDKRRALEAGFDHHLTKPVKISELNSLINRLTRP